MAHAGETGSRPMRFAWPIIGVAIPAALALARRGRKQVQSEISKEQMLIDESRLDLQGALRTALKFIAGTPVEVELQEQSGIPVWEVEVIPRNGGPVREVLIDGRTGDLLEMRCECPEA